MSLLLRFSLAPALPQYCIPRVKNEPIFRSADGEDWQLDYGHSAYQSSEVPVRMIPTSRNCKSNTSEGRLSFSNTATGVE